MCGSDFAGDCRDGTIADFRNFEWNHAKSKGYGCGKLKAKKVTKEVP
jgi:hypothetical protein